MHPQPSDPEAVRLSPRPPKETLPLRPRVIMAAGRTFDGPRLLRAMKAIRRERRKSRWRQAMRDRRPASETQELASELRALATMPTDRLTAEASQGRMPEVPASGLSLDWQPPSLSSSISMRDARPPRKVRRVAETVAEAR